MRINQSPSVSAPLVTLIREAIGRNGGWLPFDRFMALALYAPGLGYYSSPGRKFGAMPTSGSDFVTAPELSRFFGLALARQVGQALAVCDDDEVWEFGAGSGALARDLLDTLGDRVSRYNIVELSGALRQRQRERLHAHADKVHWFDTLPENLHGVVIGNEVLDAMPVQLLHFDGRSWLERGVVNHDGAFAWADRASALSAPVQPAAWPGTTTEIHTQAEAFIATLAARLHRGVMFFLDYGFPEHEYYHPQRRGGTLMCHRAHQNDADPLVDVGQKDITAHINFTAIALAGQDNGLTVLGYASQARFLLNCGLLVLLESADVKERVHAQKLITEHEMGELFKVIGFAKGVALDALGFASGDRCHTL